MSDRDGCRYCSGDAKFYVDFMPTGGSVSYCPNCGSEYPDMGVR